ncbi:cytochrome-c peroxidase [Psychrobium sp. 1_MG-2023]|uniref:cytochrome-c peroxidase n=1 Tax=Psychrobium sp. 1_MG-2023 TaxID=3062624 RepID=UPI00273609C1|nr:cytochrome c peroxidase [Psychrobium sp. 1_MG-2023]MDP2559755.1 cytochrome c peroxidase [Psychrobium sp. 1_MG-2023]
MLKYLLIAITTVLLLLVIGGLLRVPEIEHSAPTSSIVNQSFVKYDARQLSPLPQENNLPPNKVKLGEALFRDPILSSDNTTACASCHHLHSGGDDGLAVAAGVFGRTGTVNSPSVFNSVFNFTQFWDGRSPNLEQQIDGPIHNVNELNSSWPEIIQRLKLNKEYLDRFSFVYNDGITKDNIIDAIVTFEHSLITPNSLFDRYLRGEETALPIIAKVGYQRFKSFGCVSCHQGINVGGNMFQRLGIMQPYFDPSSTNPSDLGRYNITKRDIDRFVFKVPSLRNVAQTAPYFHDGSVATLDEAIEIMAKYQLGKDISAEDVVAIKAFLNTLSGEWKGNKE